MFKVRKAYQDALLQRSLYPLKSGEYKLKEVKDFAEKYYIETQKIAKSKQTGNLSQLIHCTPGDMHTWLKSAPEFIAEELGYKVAPAIKGLTGDDLTPPDIQRLRMLIQPRIDALLNECDHVDNLIYNNIGLEYEHMKRDASLVAYLYDQLYHLMDFILTQVHHCQNQTPLKPNSIFLQNLSSKITPASTLLKYLYT